MNLPGALFCAFLGPSSIHFLNGRLFPCAVLALHKAGKSVRTTGRTGYRSGHYPRNLVTPVGKLELRVPQDRQGRFSTELFSRYQRSEKALVTALMEMYVQSVSTQRVKAITEEHCGHEFSASAVSALNVNE